MFRLLKNAFKNLFIAKTPFEEVNETGLEEVSVYTPCFENCVSLETSVEIFSKIYEIKNVSIEVERWRIESYNNICNYMKLITEPTFDEIDAMLMVCNILLEHKKKDWLTEFIFMCPEKFIITYSNNSERTPYVLKELKRLDLYNVCEYMISHTHKSKLATWGERNCI